MLAKYQYESGVNNGRLQKMTFGNDQTVQYSYDKFDRTTKEQYNNVTYEYAYDASGQLAKQTSTAGEEYNYEYDSLGRLIRSNEYNDGEFEQRTEHIYDASNRLTKQNWYNAGGVTTMSYAYSTTTNYTYGNSAWRDLLTAYNGGSITYSGGNPTKYYDGSTFTWTQGRRLATAKVGSTNISYTYDMAGVRSSKTVGSTKYDFTTLSGLVTRQTGGGKTIDFVYDENNQPLAMKYNNTLYYYVLNAQGDVVRIVNSSRSVVASYTYDPWGKIISSSGTLADINPLRYRGYYYDSETGFYYLQSRYYDPEIGRFINADSYASTDATGLLSTNMFAYCENDPVNKSDPSGEAFSLITIAVGATVGALVNAAGTAAANILEGKDWNDGIGLALLSGAVSGAVSTISMNPAARLAISAVASAAESVYDQVKNDGSVNLGRLTADVAIGTISGCRGYIGNNLTGSFVKSGNMLKGQIGNAFKSKNIFDGLKRAGRNYLKRTLKLYKGEFFSVRKILKGISSTAGYNYASNRVWK